MPKFVAYKMAVPYRKLGIIREGKMPPDRRVPLTPDQCRTLLEKYPDTDLVVQRSPIRAFGDKEYAATGIPLVDELNDRDLILGVKEVPLNTLLADKAYLFFSHTIKEQEHNRDLLRTVLDRRITLMDHELLADPMGNRVLAFGHWAGVVGAYNAFRAWQLVHGAREPKAAHACRDLGELEQELEAMQLADDLRVVVTGSGRVGNGAMGILERGGLKKVAPQEFLDGNFDGPAYTLLDTGEIYARDDGQPFDKHAFRVDPTGHRSLLANYTKRAGMYVACHFWDARGPQLLTAQDLRDPASKLRVVADISCDIDGPIDSTLRASTIDEPFYGYDPTSEKEVAVGTPGSITVMAVDNLPCELPREASTSFGNDLLEHVLPHLLGNDALGMIDRATIARDGSLTKRFSYLSAYAGITV